MLADSRSLAASPFFVPALILVALSVVTALGALLGLPVALLAAAALVLALVITLMWQSLQHLSGEAALTLDEAFSLAAPTVEEEQKRAVLRALKDLEYERSVGKVSQADYLELSARYREDAKRLILAVDESLADKRAHAERLLDERLSPETHPSPGTPRKRRKKAKPSAAAQAQDAPSTEASPGEPSDGSTEASSGAPASDESRRDEESR